METSDDFFQAPTFLSWLPDETLFSLVSRHHYFWGHGLAASTCETFFGLRKSGSQHDLPSRLSHFVARTAGCFGDAKEIAKGHTLLAYYAAFLSADDLQSALDCMAGDSVAHLRLKLGIQTSRFRANHPLKACEACMDEDRAAHGWAYWHTVHQFPGVWTCPKHGQLLKESNLKASGVQRFQWHLPNREDFRALDIDKMEAIACELDAIQSLSDQTFDLTVLSSDLAVNTGRLHEVYRAELTRRGWVTAGGNFRMPEIAASFLEHAARLRVLPELNPLPATLEESVTQLGRLLRPPRSGTHPLRHLVLINWLFRKPELFRIAYASACIEPVQAEKQTLNLSEVQTSEIEDARHSDLIRMLTVESLSMRKAALLLGIDVGTAMSWAARAGLPVSRRPKKLTGAIRQQAITDLQNGGDKVVVASSAEVSVVTITKLLLIEAGLHAQWVSSRERHARESTRRIWVQLLQTHGQLGVKLMRAMEPASYAWLYRNDRAWLDEHKPDRLPAIATTGTPRAMWDTRDAEFSVEVERVALELRQNDGVRRIKLWQIYQAFPALKAKLLSLHRLPLTRRAIELALQRPATPKTQANLFG